MTTRTLDLDNLHLLTGSHYPNDEHRMCVMEAVAFLAGEEWSDHPACASRIVGTFLRAWNDVLPDDQRQELRQYIPRLVGSAGTPEQEERRSWMALDWLVRVQAPAWLRLAGLTGQADMLAGMAEVTPETCPSISSPLQAVRQDAAAARAAAWAAARERLAPTAHELRAEAHRLVDRMLAVTE